MHYFWHNILIQYMMIIDYLHTSTLCLTRSVYVVVMTSQSVAQSMLYVWGLAILTWAHENQYLTWYILILIIVIFKIGRLSNGESRPDWWYGMQLYTITTDIAAFVKLYSSTSANNSILAGVQHIAIQNFFALTSVITQLTSAKSWCDDVVSQTLHCF